MRIAAGCARRACKHLVLLLAWTERTMFNIVMSSLQFVLVNFHAPLPHRFRPHEGRDCATKPRDFGEKCVAGASSLHLAVGRQRR
jgi:hypothetical protein